jgi:hypothetical protein
MNWHKTAVKLQKICEIRRVHGDHWCQYSATDNAVTVSYFKGMVVSAPDDFFSIYALYLGYRPAATIPGLLFLAWIVLEAYAMARGESKHTRYMCRQ